MTIPILPELSPRSKLVLERMKQAKLVADIVFNDPTVEQVLAVYDRIVGRTDA